MPNDMTLLCAGSHARRRLRTAWRWLPGGYADRFLTEWAPSAQQVHNDHHQSDHQEDVDQAACKMQAEAQQPQDQQNGNDCPKHVCSPSLANERAVSRDIA